MNLNNIFQKIFVVSLVDSESRRKNIQEQCKEYEISFEFIDAINYKNLDLEKMHKNYSIAYQNNNFYCSRRCSCNGSGHKLRTTSIANQLSHLKAWKTILKENLENALILEDDIVFNKKLNHLVKDYEIYLPNKWNIMYLSTNEEINFKHRINKVKRGFSGSHMYGISASASKLAINYLYPLRAHTDGYLNRFLIQKKWGSKAFILLCNKR